MIQPLWRPSDEKNWHMQSNIGRITTDKCPYLTKRPTTLTVRRHFMNPAAGTERCGQYFHVRSRKSGVESNPHGWSWTLHTRWCAAHYIVTATTLHQSIDALLSTIRGRKYRSRSGGRTGYKNAKRRITVNGTSISQLRDVTCHMGSHNLSTCHHNNLPPDTNEHASPTCIRGHQWFTSSFKLSGNRQSIVMFCE